MGCPCVGDFPTRNVNMFTKYSNSIIWNSNLDDHWIDMNRLCSIWNGNLNLLACRRVLWILSARSCTVCFVFVLSRLSPWRGFLPRLTWTPPPPPSPPSSSSFRLDLSLRCGGLNSAHASLNTGSVLHILLSFRWLLPFFVVFAIGLLRRFLYPILDPLAFAPNTFCTHNLSKYGLFQNPGLHTCFGLNLDRGLNKTNVFASKPSFTQRAVLHKNCVIHKHQRKGCLQPTG